MAATKDDHEMTPYQRRVLDFMKTVDEAKEKYSMIDEALHDMARVFITGPEALKDTFTEHVLKAYLGEEFYSKVHNVSTEIFSEGQTKMIDAKASSSEKDDFDDKWLQWETY